MGDVIDFAAWREQQSRQAHPSAVGADDGPFGPVEDPHVWCTTCRSQWFRLVPGITPGGTAHDATVCVTAAGVVTHWTGALVCTDCGAGPFFMNVTPVGGIEAAPPVGEWVDGPLPPEAG